MERLSPNATLLQPSISLQSKQQDIENTHHKLIYRYFKVFSVLRGGNHPYLAKYVAHLHSLGLGTPNLEAH
jgi:hypothetical protein